MPHFFDDFDYAASSTLTGKGSWLAGRTAPNHPWSTIGDGTIRGNVSNNLDPGAGTWNGKHADNNFLPSTSFDFGIGVFAIKFKVKYTAGGHSLVFRVSWGESANFNDTYTELALTYNDQVADPQVITASITSVHALFDPPITFSMPRATIAADFQEFVLKRNATDSDFELFVNGVSVGSFTVDTDFEDWATITTPVFQMQSHDQTTAQTSEAEWIVAELGIDSALPTAPNTLAATADHTQINLTWVDASDNETQFDLIYSTASDFLTAPVTVSGWRPAGSTTGNIGGLAPSTQYYFKVRATNAMGSSAYTSSANATTGLPFPARGGLNLGLSLSL